MGELKVKIETLTPLWTGGIDGTMDRIHETGIIGSLRWWYEAIVRGLGGSACDSTSENRCPDNQGQYCDVCQVFGATGWKRRFQIQVIDTEMHSIIVDKRVTLRERQYTDKNGKEITPQWYFPNPPEGGDFVICIKSLHPTFNPQVVAGLIRFISTWTALGARVQMGFGVIQTAENVNIQSLCEHLSNISGNHKYHHLPSLSNIFLAKIQPQSGYSFEEKDTFMLKYDLRRLFSNHKAIRHFVMGTTKNQKLAAKIKISRPYNNEIRVWGWIPEKSDVYDQTWDREKILQTIYQHLKTSYKLIVWREMNSPRDAVSPKLSDAKAFFKSLLNCGE